MEDTMIFEKEVILIPASGTIDLIYKYGDLGKDFTHVHHIIPLNEIKEEYNVNPLTDLIPICPNCHAIIHRKNPAYTPNEIKAILRK